MNAKPPKHRLCELGLQGGSKCAECSFEKFFFSNDQKTFGKACEIPEQRIGLAAIGVEAGGVKISRCKGRIEDRQKSPGAVIEAFAGHVDVVGIEHAMHKARHNPLRSDARNTAANLFKKCGGARGGVIAPCVGHVSMDRIVEQLSDVVRLSQKSKSLK